MAADSRCITEQLVTIRQLDTKERLLQDLYYNAFKAYAIFSRHVKISGSPSVMSTVCSKWADN